MNMLFRSVKLTRIALVLLGTAAILLFASLAGGVQAQTNGITMAVRAGFDGYYKDAHWLPVHVSLANDGPDVTGTLKIAVPRSDGSTIDYTRSVELPSGARKEIYMFVAVEGYLSKVTVDYVSGSDHLATQTARVAQLAGADQLYGVLASSPSAFNILTQVDPPNGQGRVAQLAVEDLPEAAVAWRALDVLIISDIDTGAFSQAQLAGLQSWVAGGGRLVVVGGANWQKTSAGLGDMLPFAPTGSANAQGLVTLGAYAFDTTPGPTALVTTGSLRSEGVALASAGDASPLIVERSLGYGRVDFLTFDPGLAPFKNWKGLEGVFRSLFSSVTDHPGWAGAYRNWYNAGEAVNAIPGVGLPNVLVVCFFVGGYVMAIGPVNYLILRHFKRRELAWLTVPALVVLFTITTYIASFGIRGSQATLHRLTVAQVWQNSNRANAETLVGIYSPRRSEYSLQVDGDMLLRPLPADTNYGSIDTSINGAVVDQGEATAIRNVRVDVGAIKPFIAQGQIDAPQFDSNLNYSLDSAQPALKGTITNKSDVALKDAVVLAFSGYQKVGDVPPGGQVDVNLNLVSNRASWAPQTQASGSSGSPSTSVSGTSGYDSTIENILGTQSYYDNRETYSRYSLLSWMFDPYNSGGRGSGTYLVGWTDKSPVNVSLINQGYNTADQTLYIVRLEPKLVFNSGTVAVPPGLMTWTVLDAGTAGAGTPYDSYLNIGSFTVRFRPFAGLDYRKVRSLTLHLQSYSSTGAAPLTVSLWNQSTGDWTQIPNVQWGDTNIESPGQFVGGDGRIDVKVENASSNSISLETLDFSLVVER